MTADLALAAWQIRNEQRAFWRNRRAAIFSFGFPIMLLLVFGLLNKGNAIEERGVSWETFYVPGILAYGVITTAFSNIEIVAQVGRGDEVLAAARAQRPDVALLDIEMPGTSGLDAAGLLRSELAATRVVILTTFSRPGYLRRAMEQGASGFLLKDAPASELAGAIRRVVAGERIVDPGLAAAALAEGESPLTAREHEVLEAARRYGTVAELAEALHLSPGTTRNHLPAIMGKLGAHSRIEAIRVAEEKGWL